MEYLNHQVKQGKANPVQIDADNKKLIYDPEFFKGISKETRLFFFRWIYYREYKDIDFANSCKKAIAWYKKKGYDDLQLIKDLKTLMSRCYKYEMDILRLVVEYL